MIVGGVNARLEAIVSLTVRGPHGATLAIDGLVDSGFTGTLTLPPAVIAELELDLQMESHYQLADGSLHSFQVYEAEVEWEGDRRSVTVLETDGSPLVGMRMLQGCELKIEIRAGGAVLIAPLGGGGAGETAVI